MIFHANGECGRGCCCGYAHVIRAIPRKFFSNAPSRPGGDDTKEDDGAHVRTAECALMVSVLICVSATTEWRDVPGIGKRRCGKIGRFFAVDCVCYENYVMHLERKLLALEGMRTSGIDAIVFYVKKVYYDLHVALLLSTSAAVVSSIKRIIVRRWGAGLQEYEVIDPMAIRQASSYKLIKIGSLKCQNVTMAKQLKGIVSLTLQSTKSLVLKTAPRK